MSLISVRCIYVSGFLTLYSDGNKVRRFGGWLCTKTECGRNSVHKILSLEFILHFSEL